MRFQLGRGPQQSLQPSLSLHLFFIYSEKHRETINIQQYNKHHYSCVHTNKSIEKLLSQHIHEMRKRCNFVRIYVSKFS